MTMAPAMSLACFHGEILEALSVGALDEQSYCGIVVGCWTYRSFASPHSVRGWVVTRDATVHFR